jgi:hypothetical protein
MALTRDFRETVQARVQNDQEFRRRWAARFCAILSMRRLVFPNWLGRPASM